MAADESQQALVVPFPLRSATELNRRTSEFSIAALARLDNIEEVLRRSSAYGGLVIDAPSSPYTGGPTIIAPWGFASPGAAGSEAINVTPSTAAGTITVNLAGVYQVSAAISGTGGTGALYTLDLYVNAARRIGFTIDQSNQSARWTLSYSFIVDLALSDVLDLRLTASSSTTIDNAVFSVTKTGLSDTDLPLIGGLP